MNECKARQFVFNHDQRDLFSSNAICFLVSRFLDLTADKELEAKDINDDNFSLDSNIFFCKALRAAFVDLFRFSLIELNSFP